MNFLKSLLEDNSGGLSSCRVVMLVWTMALFGTWVTVAYKTKSLPDVPTGVLTLTGMILGGKVVQRFGETPSQ